MTTIMRRLALLLTLLGGSSACSSEASPGTSSGAGGASTAAASGSVGGNTSGFTGAGASDGLGGATAGSVGGSGGVSTGGSGQGVSTGSSAGAGASAGQGGATSGGASTGGMGAGGGGTPVPPPYMLGADVSFIQEEEDRGTFFTDGGTQKDIFELLQDRGFNYIRLRLFHTPGNPGGYQYEFATRAEPYCDQAHTIEMAGRVKAAGMRLLLDFHFSDTWADPDDQHKPAAWEGLTFQDLVTAVHDYTRDTLLAFDAAGALPDMVQIGNEITPGMLLPDGATYDPDNWDQLAELLKAGLSAVEEVDDRILTMLHIDRGGDNETSVWWVDQALARGVSFDVLGQSAYSAFHGGPADWEANLADLATRYPNLFFVIAEYNGDKRAVNDIVRGLPGGRGVGTFFWEPTASGEWGSAMFTRSGNEARAVTSDFAIYDQIADDYGLR
ncbi:MAG TPA: glycosyl hydrolase 53 family protein [Polyangiaceae bacterium]